MFSPGKKEQIIVVTADPAIANVIKEAMAAAYEVLVINEPQKAVLTIGKLRPKLVVIGCTAPAGTGYQLYNALTNGWATRNIPVLILDKVGGQEGKALPDAEISGVTRADYIALSINDVNELRNVLIKRLLLAANTFKSALVDTNNFCVTWEQIPGRGSFETSQAEVLENARLAAAKGKVHAVSLTDNPGGSPAISPIALSSEIKKLGIEPLVHVALRDKNRNECESSLYALAAAGVRNVLMLTGDYPSSAGFKGQGKPVFDLDSVQGLQLINTLNQGMEFAAFGKAAVLTPTDFCTGSAISPFKQTEAELIGQYSKLQKKIAAGAQFAVTQVGYDARKLHEVLQWLNINHYVLPLIANIYILPYGAGKTMHANQIPGCVVTDKLLQQLETERGAKDKGKTARLERAAKMYAIAKGMGCRGAHIGGHGSTYDMVDYVITRGEELTPKWQELTAEFDYPQPDGFYFFQKDPETGLNTSIQSPRIAQRENPPVYSVSRIIHKTVFNQHSPVFKTLLPLAEQVDKGPRMKRAFGKFEHLNKALLFDCMDCGDCALFDCAYICPMSQCPKGQRNGPCGGSFAGWCEVYPGQKRCIWVSIYLRLKKHRQETGALDYIVPPCDWELNQTSSWLNYYLGRDHTAKRLGIRQLSRLTDAATPEGKKTKNPK